MLNLSKLDDNQIKREGELIKLVVKTVLSELGRDFKLHIPKELVGLDGHVKEIINWIDCPSDYARMIGIYGVSGIGKTTFAKCIYNQLWNKFGHVSFLADIGETAQRHGIKYLQSQLISDILQSKHQVLKVDDGISLIKSKFKKEKVLIILDDIDCKDQLNALARNCNWFASESIIIVTTRDKAVLEQSEFEIDFKYELSQLDKVHSLILFSRYAFQMDHPLRDFVDISREIVSRMAGLPLALEVVGSYLYKKPAQNVWNDVLKQLRQPHGDVQNILKISYDALEDGHKQIFLDIASFYIGKESKFVVYMWENREFCASRGIEELKSRCLIKIGEDGTLKMHDQLRDLGRNLVCQGQQSKKQSRVRVSKEAFTMEEKGNEMIEANCGDELCDHPFFYYGPTDHLRTYIRGQFKDLQSSGFPQLNQATLTEDFNKLSSKLRWLRWFGIEPDLPLSATNLHLPNLAVLQLSYNQIMEDWTEWSSIMMAKRLKVLDLTSCEYLRCTPDLSAFTKLEILILKDCYKLEQVDSSIGKIKSLVSLNLSGCGSLKELPGEVGELVELKELVLDFSGIVEIATSISTLRKLEKLSAWACRSLTEISSSIWDLENLQHLEISESPIKKLPGAIGRLKRPSPSALPTLKVLILKNCYELEQVHLFIGKVKGLVSLDLSGCFRLKELPGEVSELEELKELILDSSGIIEITTSIGSLRKLEKLSVRACQSVREIPSSIWDLHSLQHLDISNSPIEKLPCIVGSLTEFNLSALTKLKILILKDCCKLEQIHPSIGKVKSLVSLDLSSCGSLKELPREVGELEELKELILDSSGIIEIPTSIGSLRKLEKLSARACRSLREIPSSIWDLKNLQHLEISESPMKKFPGAVGRLKKPVVSVLPKLKVLILKNYYKLKRVHRFVGKFKSLVSLDLSLKVLILKNCYNLKRVHRFVGKFKSLVSLDLSGCNSLMKLPGEVGKLEELRELILDSSGITKIPTSIGSLRKLEKLSVRACRSLREIPSSIGYLQNLRHLDISKSPIRKLPSAIGRLKKLWRLHLKKCRSLEGEIPREIGELSSLEILEITGAPIFDLPESIRNLSSLKRLSIQDCRNLRSLPELPSSLKYLNVSYQGPRLLELSHLIHLEKVHLSWKRST